MSWGDTLTYAAEFVKGYTDPVAKLAADAYESITGNGFKPIKKASDADVKKLTAALKKSASSTEMLATITECEAKQESKPAQRGDNCAPATKAILAQAPRTEQAAKQQEQTPETKRQEQNPQVPLKIESQPRVRQTERPRILAQTQQEAPLTRVQAELPLDSKKQESVLDFTSKLRDAAASGKVGLQAKDDKFLSNILTGAEGDNTRDSAPRVNEIPITRQDWEVISNAKSQAESPSLPKLEIVNTIFGSERNEEPGTRSGSSEGTIDCGANSETHKDHQRQIVQKPDGSLIYDEGTASITHTQTGEVLIQGTKDTIKVLNGKLVALDKDGNAYLDTNPEGKTRAALGNGSYLLPGLVGATITDALGNVIGKIRADQILRSHKSLQIAQYTDEADFKTVMDRWYREGNKMEPGKTALLLSFKGGFAVVEPRDDKYTVVLEKGRKKFEVHQKLADNITVVKDADNQFFLTTKTNRLQLSAEQIEMVLQDLPEEQQKNLRKFLANVEKGLVDVPDGQLNLNGERAEYITTAAQTIAGVAAPSVKFSYGDNQDELVERRADGSEMTTQLDRRTNTYEQKETDTKGEVTETKFQMKHGPKADGLKVTGKNWSLEKGIFTNSDGFKIDEHGTVRTPGGSVVQLNGDIKYSNGMILEGGVLRERSKPESAQTAPTDKHVDSLIRTGLSLAKSLASGGPATFAQIALLQANLSIVSNLVGLFSDMGQLQEATKLFKVWATMNESLCKACAEVDERTARIRPDQVSQPNNIAIFSGASDRFSSNTPGSGGWISCHLKAA